MPKPQPICSILEKTLKGLEMDAPLKSYSIWGAWREIVGEPVALQSQPCSIRNRILFVEVSHPTWIQQLQFLKPTLLEKVNAYIGEPLIQDIRFRLGKIAPLSCSTAETDFSKEGGLEEETLKRIEALLLKIEDGEVRRSLGDVLIKGAKLERRRGRSK
jgi:hypothetical protein